jgi:hypothetical protein
MSVSALFDDDIFHVVWPVLHVVPDSDDNLGTLRKIRVGNGRGISGGEEFVVGDAVHAELQMI